MEWSAKKGVHAHPDPQQRHQTPRSELTRTFDSLCLPSKEGGRGDKETEEDKEEEETDEEGETEEGKDKRAEEWSATMFRARQASKHTQ